MGPLVPSPGLACVEQELSPPSALHRRMLHFLFLMKNQAKHLYILFNTELSRCRVKRLLGVAGSRILVLLVPQYPKGTGC